jgi:hypothetical protein
MVIWVRLLFAILIVATSNLASLAQESRSGMTKIIVDRYTSFQTTSRYDEETILDNFAVTLLNTPDQIGYIIVYAGRAACAGAAQARGMRMKKYLVERRHVPWDHVIWKDAGHLQEPYVLLEMQVRGGEWYEYSYPPALPPHQVKIINCARAANLHRRRST